MNLQFDPIILTGVINDVGINFLLTVPGGKSTAAHVDTPMLAPGQPCESVNLSLTGSPG